MKIDSHISELLNDHDCVIVPGMGGFIRGNPQGGINSERQSHELASKIISFNNFLTHNDGLLAEHIARCENLEFNEALKEIKTYVRQYHQEVDSGKKFSIGQVGILYADDGRNVRFEPFKDSNNESNSPEQTMEPVMMLEKEFSISDSPFESIENIPVNQESKIVNPESPKSNRAYKMLSIGGIFFLLLLMCFVALRKVYLLSWNTFSRTSSIGTITKGTEEVHLPAPQETTINVKSSESATKDSDRSAIASSPEKLQDKKYVHNFYIVAGTFHSIENAIRLESELKSQGFSDATIIDTTTPLKMVSFSSYSTRETAMQELSRFKAERREGWIYPR
jgi:hypothetical protein